MKHLLTLILLLCALTTHAQNSRRATVQPDTFSYKVDLAKVPKSSWDSSEFPRRAYQHRTRPRGTICTVVGLGMIAGGALMSATSNGEFGYGLLSVFLISSGTGLTLVGGAIMLSSIHDRDRYSVVLHPNGLGLAYNF